MSRAILQVFLCIVQDQTIKEIFVILIGHKGMIFSVAKIINDVQVTWKGLVSNLNLEIVASCKSGLHA